jgi:hypothetical protein
MERRGRRIAFAAGLDQDFQAFEEASGILVLWVLGSMLGATQSVDMISSLKRNYGHVEVAVLNVELLPNSIDMIVIGDRLFSLPNQVERVEGNEVHNNQIDGCG